MTFYIPDGTLDQKRRLNNRLLEIETERERALKLPQVTEAMVNDLQDTVFRMLDVTNLQELKITLSHFIERIEISGREMTIQYSVAPPTTGIVSTNGDPGGASGFDAISRLRFLPCERSFNIDYTPSLAGKDIGCCLA